MLKFYIKTFRSLVFTNPVMDLVYIWYEDIYWYHPRPLLLLLTSGLEFLARLYEVHGELLYPYWASVFAAVFP